MTGVCTNFPVLVVQHSDHPQGPTFRQIMVALGGILLSSSEVHVQSDVLHIYIYSPSVKVQHGGKFLPETIEHHREPG